MMDLEKRIECHTAGLSEAITEIKHEIREGKRVEKSLRKQQRLLKTILDVTPDMLMLKDLNFVYTAVNTAACRFFGKLENEIVGKTDFDLLPLDEAQICRRGDMRVLETGLPQIDDEEASGTGGERWLQVAKTPVLDETGSAVGILCSIRDISERKRLEDSLRHQGEFQRIISQLSTKFINLESDEIDDGINYALREIGEIADVDRSYVFQYYENGKKMDNTHEWCAEGIEPQIQNCQGLLSDEFPWCKERISRFETIHIPRVADLPPEAIERELFESQDIQSLICVPMVSRNSLIGFIGFDSVRKDKIWSEDIIALMKIVGEMFANVLERKRVEQALKESEKRYCTVSELTSDYIARIGIDSNGKMYLDSVTDKYTHVMGFSAVELRNPDQWYKVIHHDDMDRVLDFLQSLRSGQSTECEHRQVTRDGEVLWLQTFGRPEFDEQGRVVAIISASKDITEKKNAEEERKRLEDLLQQARRLEAIGTLSGGVAHDFNNLLMVIQGYTSLMLDNLDPTHPHYGPLKKIEERVKSGAWLTSQLLAYARKGRYEVKPLDLNEIVREAAETFGRTKKEITIRREFSEDLYAI